MIPLAGAVRNGERDDRNITDGEESEEEATAANEVDAGNTLKSPFVDDSDDDDETESGDAVG